VSGDAVITQGDGWILCDQPVRVSQVIGEVISYCDGGKWHSFIAEPVRLTSDTRAARRQVRIIASCLRLNIAFARFVARQVIRLYTFRRHCKQLLVMFCRRG
jgi:hypothetical protein